jgi:hypothetical protein
MFVDVFEFLVGTRRTFIDARQSVLEWADLFVALVENYVALIVDELRVRTQSARSWETAFHPHGIREREFVETTSPRTPLTGQVDLLPSYAWPTLNHDESHPRRRRCCLIAFDVCPTTRQLL